MCDIYSDHCYQRKVVIVIIKWSNSLLLKNGGKINDNQSFQIKVPIFLLFYFTLEESSFIEGMEFKHFNSKQIAMTSWTNLFMLSVLILFTVDSIVSQE